MLEILEFALDGFWRFVGFSIILSLVLFYLVNGAFKIWNRLVRLIVISLRGWPPAHLDADGDWKRKSIVTKEKS